jgi:hypothetical protein
MMNKFLKFIASVSISLIALGAPLLAKTWSLENTPKEYRAGFCYSFRNSVIYDRTTQTYKMAMARKLNGTANNQSRARLAYSYSLISDMKKLRCGNIP